MTSPKKPAAARGMSRYTIKKGDSLSKIAKDFGMESWKPIWKFNTAVQSNLTGKDPDVIPTGAAIVIPRSAEAYDESTKKLAELRASVGREMGDLITDVDKAKSEADRMGDRVDFGADVLMIGKGVVKASFKLGKRYLKYKMKKSALEAAQKSAVYFSGLSGSSNEELVVQKTGEAAVDQSIMVMARRKFDGAKSREKFAKGMGKSYAKKGAVMIAKTAGPTECANGVGDVVAIIADIALSGVEAVNPSAVAKTWVWATTGEHPDDTAKRAKEHIRRQASRSYKRLSDAIKKLKKEKAVVYGP